MKKIPSPNDLAKELVNVQPVTNEGLKDLYELCKSKEELEAEGYRPVSSLGLMYVKK